LSEKKRADEAVWVRLILELTLTVFAWGRAMQSNNVESQRTMTVPSITASWQGILDVVPAAAYTCDAVGKITYFNRMAEFVWGRTPKLRDASELYCGSYRLYLSDGTPIAHRQCWMALALLEGAPYHGREIVIERQDGSRRSGLAYAHPVRNGQGQIIGALNLVADVTARAEPAIPFSATLAMIEVVMGVFAGLSWQ
jgi:PAS domain-containing protein